MSIYKIHYNWYYTPENGEAYSQYELGKSYGMLGEVESIHEYKSMGDGDKWRYEVLFSTGKTTTVFNINQVFTKED